MNNDINLAVKILNMGGIIIFPTDTAFGIGCRIDKKVAIEKLFKIRKRPLNQATPVLVSDKDMARKYLLDIPQKVETELMDKYWPGALTIVLPAKVDLVSPLVRGGEKNLGVRVPANETILEIIKHVGVPILGPSANFHGDPTPYSIGDLNQELMRYIDFIVNGQTSTGKTSTVIDCSKKSWKILREGAVSINIK